jgi:predicted nucleic acid-binding protein
LGGKAAEALVLALDARIRVYAPRQVQDEVTEWLPRLAQKRGLDEHLLLGAFALMPIEWKEYAITQRYKDEALRRIGDRDPDDWPTVALAIDAGHDYKLSDPPSGRWARWLWSAGIEGRHRMNEVLLAMQSPMTSPGKPVKKNPRTWIGAQLYKALNRPDRLMRITVAIWSADKDYAASGIETIRTGELLRLLGK